LAVHEFCYGKRPQMKQKISPCQRIASFLIDVQPATTSNQELIGIIKLIVNPLEIVFPILVFVNFVKYYQWSRQIFALNSFKEGRIPYEAGSVLRDIPIPIKAISVTI